MWVFLELTAQLARLDLFGIWKVKLFGNRGGMALHPLLIFVTNPQIEAHEIVHAKQMARMTWTGFVIFYLLSGEWRVRLEAEAYKKTSVVSVGLLMRKLSGSIYFPSFVKWQQPSEDRMREIIKEFI